MGSWVMGHGPECRHMLVRQQSRDWSGCEAVCNIARVTWRLRRIFITSLIKYLHPLQAVTSRMHMAAAEKKGRKAGLADWLTD